MQMTSVVRKQTSELTAVPRDGTQEALFECSLARPVFTKLTSIAATQRKSPSTYVQYKARQQTADARYTGTVFTISASAVC